MNNIDMLYRIFYTVFSMSCMALVLLPAVLVLRFLFRGLSKKFRLALWAVLFLRAVCPVGMSSPVCIYGAWNRQFHRFLRSLGLTITPDRGLLTGWRHVFEGEVTASGAYRTCTLIWLAGAVILLLVTAWKQLALARNLKRSSELLFDNIYQSGQIAYPVRTGLFHGRIYLPEGLLAKEMKDIIAYQRLRQKRGDDLWRRLAFLVCCIHWWNPGIWFAYYLLWRDQNLACDQAFVRQMGSGQQSHCAQVLVNMKQDRAHKLSTSLVTGFESDLFRRSEALLYAQRKPLWQSGIAAFILTVLFFVTFGLSAFRGGQTEGDSAEALFDSNAVKQINNRVIARCETKTASGSAVTLELVVEKGTHRASSGYHGKCQLRLRNSQKETLAALALSEVFAGSATQDFRDDVSLETVDYNEDGRMEIAIGQRSARKASDEAVSVTNSAVAGQLKKQNIYEYYMIDIGEDKLTPVSPEIYVSDVTALQEGSMVFSYVQGAGGVITVSDGEDTSYYVWNHKKSRYELKDLTDEQLEKRREKYGTDSAQTRQYFLKTDDGKEIMDVSVSAQSNGGLSINRIRINPKGLDQRAGTKTITNVEGYYYDLQWAQSDSEEQRYALLSYNGTAGRTFALYDVKKQRLCYQPAEGNEALQKVFKEYGADDIQFEKNGAVVYSLMEITGDDVLKVNFAASAKDDISVKGTYQYHLPTGNVTSLQYSRES
ncbi:M56 family metallopeptidase [Jutongia sp.]